MYVYINKTFTIVKYPGMINVGKPKRTGGKMKKKQNLKLISFGAHGVQATPTCTDATRDNDAGISTIYHIYICICIDMYNM